MNIGEDTCLPISPPLTGVVTWYAPDGAVIALATTWLGIINGQPPELRVGCRGPTTFAGQFPVGVDFVLNVPASPHASPLQSLLDRQRHRRLRRGDSSVELRPAHLVQAPLLACCPLQIECAGGRLLLGDWETELVGDILLLHRAGCLIKPAEHTDFCAIRPLQIFMPH